MKVDNPYLSDYGVAWLLWPQSDNWPWDGEIDFPESSLTGTAHGYHHYARQGSCNTCQLAVNTVPATPTGTRTRSNGHRTGSGCCSTTPS